MKARPWVLYLVAALTLLLTGCAVTNPRSAGNSDPKKAQITILYDAFGKPSAMEKDWGYAALIEYGGKRILFDTGDNPDILAKNAKAKGVDLSKLDFVVMSHRHGDHMGGMSYLLSVNPNVKIYAPKESFGVYGFSLPSKFYRKDESLPPEQRYYDGAPPEVMKFGSAWPNANFELIEKTTEIAPGVHLIALVSDKPTTLELRELSLAIDTPDGIVLVVGCSHPGIDKIVEAATSINKRIHLVTGGFHLVVAKDPDIEKIVTGLRDTWKVDYVAPGHCTGEPTFTALKRAFGEHYLYAGLGTTIALGATPRPAAEAGQDAAIAMDEDDIRSYRALLAKGHDHEDTVLAYQDE
ncbi:MAG TPA: MBL fold metallo-hydrolase [Burkholderiales bacterium]|nr:MBL fold metallo-hydrolase [Burkholderiales bacterium]